MILMLTLLGLASAYVVPISYSQYGAVPLPYHYPAYQVAPVHYATYPVVHPGYVAKTPGAEHYAPLPAGLAYASHHINNKPAPGTV